MNRHHIRIPYRPNPAQADFHAARHTVPERALEAGTGSGKTVSAAFEVFSCALEEPGSTWICGEPTGGMLDGAMLPAWAIMLGEPIGQHPLTKDWHQTKRRLRLPNGSTVWFVSFEKPLSIEGPPEIDGVWADEGRVIRRFSGADGVWKQLTRRLRGRSDRMRRAILTTHSPTIEITQTFKEASEKRITTGHRLPLPDGSVHEASYTRSQCTDPLRNVWSWSPLDSAAWGTLQARDATRIASEYHGTDYTRIVLGRYARPSNVVYDTFSYARHVAPAPIRQAADAISYGVDIGWTHHAVIIANYWLGGSVHSVAELAVLQAGVKGVVAGVQHLVEIHGPGAVHVGTDVRAPETVKALRDAGLDAHAVTGQQVEDGVFVLRSRQQADSWLIAPRRPDASEGETRGCPLLIQQMDLYQRDPVTNRILDRDNDAVDAARYGIVGKEPSYARVLRPSSRR